MACSDLEQVMGIEPTCSAWEADILPLNYTCIFHFSCIVYHSFPVDASTFFEILRRISLTGPPLSRYD